MSAWRVQTTDGRELTVRTTTDVEVVIELPTDDGQQIASAAFDLSHSRDLRRFLGAAIAQAGSGAPRV